MPRARMRGAAARARAYEKMTTTTRRALYTPYAARGKMLRSLCVYMFSACAVYGVVYVQCHGAPLMHAARNTLLTCAVSVCFIVARACRSARVEYIDTFATPRC